MRKILLRNTGHYALVDNDEYDRIMAFGRWYENDQGYAVKRQKIDGENTTIRMHSLINRTPKNLVTDHINGNKLDNRKKNLRSVGQMINCWNKKHSGMKHRLYDLPEGITFDKSRNKYVARKITIKRFATLKEAKKFVKESERSIYARH